MRGKLSRLAGVSERSEREPAGEIPSGFREGSASLGVSASGSPRPKSRAAFARDLLEECCGRFTYRDSAEHDRFGERRRANGEKRLGQFATVAV